MGRNCFNDLNNSSEGFDASQIEYYDECLKNRINSLRKKGYSEDDILLLLLDNGCRTNSTNNDNSVQEVKSKRYIYTSDIHNK